MRVVSKTRAVIGLGLRQLSHDRARTLLAVVGICLAVLSMTVLASVGLGVVETGQEKFDASGRDLWVTGGAVRLAPGTVGGFENTVYDAHALSADLQSRPEVKTAVPMAFQTVYVSADGSEFETLVGTGAPARGGSVSISEGRGFSSADVHYGDGSYDGPMTHEIVVSPQTADRFGVGVNDTLYVGGTVGSATRNEFRVVGISSTFSSFLGTSTVVMHLSELQEVTGTTGNDRATMITIDLREDASATDVAAEIQQAHPQYEVRTNREQLQATLRRQAVVIAAGVSLVGLAAVAGIALTTNLLLSLVYQQRRTLAALRAQGSTASTLVGAVTVQAACLGVAGGALGVGLTPPILDALNVVAVRLVGFEEVVSVHTDVLVAGFAIAVVMSLFAAAVAGWRIARLSPLEHLE
jgi:putative ABC transport system permease protein